VKRGIYPIATLYSLYSSCV